MNESIEKRVIKNTLLGIFSFVITFLQTVVTVPLLLHFWGKEVYGFWLSLFAGYALLQTLDFGHQSFVGNKLNLLYHTNKEEFKKVLGSSLIVAYIIGLIQVLICLYIVFAGLIGDFLNTQTSSLETLHIEISLIALILSWFFLGSAGGVIGRILIPAGMMYEFQWWNIFSRFSQVIAIILAAVSGGEILTAALLVVVVQSIFMVLTLLYIKRKLPEFFPWWKIRDLKTALQNFRYSLVLTANAAAQQLSSNGIILFIAKFMQTSMVPVFTTLRTITNTATNVTNIFINALVPDIVRFHARGEKEKLIISLNTNWFVCGVIVNTGIILLLPFVKEIYLLWTNGQLEFNFSLFLCLAVSVSLFNFGAGLNAYLININDLTAQVIITSTRVVAIFITGFLLLKSSGILGLGIGIVLSEILASVILTVFFVNLHLRKMRASLNPKSILLALIPPVIIILDSIIFSWFGYNLFFISFLSLVVLLVHYYINWLLLDIEIKKRFRHILSKVFSFNILSDILNK